MQKIMLKIQVLSDIMLGSGESVPGIIDNDIKYNEYGLPYMHAKTLKGHLREQMELIKRVTEKYVEIDINSLMGSNDADSEKKLGKLKFSDLKLSIGVEESVKQAVNDHAVTSEEIIDSLTKIYAYTKIGENGVAEDHSLRKVRMINKGLVFYSELFAENISKQEFDFLDISVKALQHIGSYKSKGKGAVQCELVYEGDEK